MPVIPNWRTEAKIKKEDKIPNSEAAAEMINLFVDTHSL